MAVKVRNIKLESATPQKEIDTSSKTHVEANAELARDLGETRDLVKKKRRVRHSSKRLATLREERKLCMMRPRLKRRR